MPRGLVGVVAIRVLLLLICLVGCRGQSPPPPLYGGTDGVTLPSEPQPIARVAGSALEPNTTTTTTTKTKTTKATQPKPSTNSTFAEYSPPSLKLSPPPSPSSKPKAAPKPTQGTKATKPKANSTVTKTKPSPPPSPKPSKPAPTTPPPSKPNPSKQQPTKPKPQVAKKPRVKNTFSDAYSPSVLNVTSPAERPAPPPRAKTRSKPPPKDNPLTDAYKPPILKVPLSDRNSTDTPLPLKSTKSSEVTDSDPPAPPPPSPSRNRTPESTRQNGRPSPPPASSRIGVFTKNLSKRVGKAVAILVVISFFVGGLVVMALTVVLGVRMHRYIQEQEEGGAIGGRWLVPLLRQRRMQYASVIPPTPPTSASDLEAARYFSTARTGSDINLLKPQQGAVSAPGPPPASAPRRSSTN